MTCIKEIEEGRSLASYLLGGGVARGHDIYTGKGAQLLRVRHLSTQQENIA